MRVKKWRALTSDEQRIVEEHVSFVRQIARHVTTDPHLQEDVFSAGIIGLIKALQTFEQGKGKTLAQYAAPWIRYAMVDAIRGLEGRRKDQIKVVRRQEFTAKAADVVSEKTHAAELLAVLPTEQMRELMQRLYVAGQRNKDVAVSMRCTPSRISQLRKRCIRGLRVLFGGGHANGDPFADHEHNRRSRNARAVRRPRVLAA